MITEKLIFVVFIISLILQTETVSAQAGWQNLTPGQINRTEIQYVNSTTAFSVASGIYKTTDNGSSWILLNAPDENNYDKLYFVNGSTGYVTVLSEANRGKILKTTNGGINWNYMPTGTNYSFGAINFINANTGYIGGNRFDQLFNGVIMKTTDGGISWNEQGPVYNYFVTCFSFPDALTGYASAGSKMFKTTDGGINWSVIPLSDLFVFDEVYFTSADTGFITGYFPNGNGNQLWKTVNGGLNWTETPGVEYIPLRRITFLNSMTGFVLATNGILFKTTNSGENWNIINLNTSLTSTSISFANMSYGTIVGYGGLIIKTTNQGNNWTQSPILTVADLYKIYFPSDQTGYAAGKYGEFLKTTNSGNNWFSVPNSITTNFVNLVFINDNTGFTGEYSGVYKTTNGGLNWIMHSTGTGSKITGLHFYDNPVNGILIDEEGRVLKTTNTGDSWIEYSTVPVFISVKSVSFAEENIIYASDDAIINAELFKSTNRGLNWFSVSHYNNFFYWGCIIDFINGNTGFAMGEDEDFNTLVLKTTDGGTSWSSYLMGTFISLTNINFINDYSGFITGTGGRIYKTSNSGTNWYSQTSGTNNILNSTFFKNSLTGYAAGNYGTILKTTTGGDLFTGLYNINENIPDAFALKQNYPNPFNPETKINYELPQNAEVELTVFDINGREVIKLVNNEFRNAGKYSVSFNARNARKGSDLSSGVYFYKLNAGSFSQTRRMILLK